MGEKSNEIHLEQPPAALSTEAARLEHYCLGAPLARLEAEVGFTTLFDQFDIVDVDTTDLSPSGSVEIYGSNRLPVTLE